MAGSSNGQMSIKDALQIAKNSTQTTPTTVQANQRLERAMNAILRSLQGQPNSYVMSPEEFSVTNYFHERYKTNELVKQAIARFWRTYGTGGNSNSTNAASSSNSGR